MNDNVSPQLVDMAYHLGRAARDLDQLADLLDLLNTVLAVFILYMMVVCGYVTYLYWRTRK